MKPSIRTIAKLSTMLFGYLIFSLALGSATNLPHPKMTMIRVTAVADPAPQTGTVPVGLPNGTAHSTALSWTASVPVSGVTIAGYNVFRSTTSGGEAGASALNGATPIAGTSFTDTSVVAGTTYFYVVAAQSTTGNQSGFSNEATDTIPNNPSNPTGCKASGS